LRCEALYSSQLTSWRREREAGALEALGRRRGRKARSSPEQKRVAALEARLARLERELEQARLIIEVPKKTVHAAGATHGRGHARAHRERILSAVAELVAQLPHASGAGGARGLLGDLVSTPPALCAGAGATRPSAAGALGLGAGRDPEAA